MRLKIVGKLLDFMWFLERISWRKIGDFDLQNTFIWKIVFLLNQWKFNLKIFNRLKR